jgi:hypothetical protein
VEILKIYQNAKRVKLFVLCFLIGHETIHHWKAYANGISGCCIEFDRAKLEKLFLAHKSDGVRFEEVNYNTIEEVKVDCVCRFPFLKRHPYKFENEFRVICIGKRRAKSFEISIDDLNVIKRITLSPQMPVHLFRTIECFLKGVLKVKAKVNLSRIIKHPDWIGKFKRAKLGEKAAHHEG